MEHSLYRHPSVKQYYSGEQLANLPPINVNFDTDTPETIAQTFSEEERLSLIINSFMVSKSSLPAHYYFMGYLNYRLGASNVFQPKNMQKGYDILISCNKLLTIPQKEILQTRMQVHHSTNIYEKLAETTLDILGPGEIEDEWISEQDLMASRITIALSRFRDSYPVKKMDEYVTWATDRNLNAIETYVYPYIEHISSESPEKTVNYLRSTANALGLMYRSATQQDPNKYFLEGEQMLQESGFRNI